MRDCDALDYERTADRARKGIGVLQQSVDLTADGAQTEQTDSNCLLSHPYTHGCSFT
jgi:hypothetical protein